VLGRFAAALLALLIPLTVLPSSAFAFGSGRPVILGLSTHRGVYWGGTEVAVRGEHLLDVREVLFGSTPSWSVHVLSDTRLVATAPSGSIHSLHVRAVSASGTSAPNFASAFRFAYPTLNTPIFGGLTAHQEQRISARVRAQHHGVATAHDSGHWTPAMGRTALRRAQSWLGLPYSWAGGNAGGPTHGVCEHNGGDLDCHVIGFDCSGLALYAWAPYQPLDHYAATQHHQAGRFHPTIGELMPGDLVFFSGYISGGIGHVAVYAGNGMVVQAEESGTTVMTSRLVDVIAGSGTYRGATRPASTGRQGAGPTVRSVTPALSTAGGTITITGRNLGSATSVSIGGERIYRFAHRSTSSVVVQAPGHATGSARVTVSNPWGTAAGSVHYVAAPAISGLSPSSGPVAGGTAVTIHGSGFGSVDGVTVDGAAVSYRAVGPSRLAITTPAHAAGRVSVTVRSSVAGSASASYTYVAAPPTTPPTTPDPTPTSTANAPWPRGH